MRSFLVQNENKFFSTVNSGCRSCGVFFFKEKSALQTSVFETAVNYPLLRRHGFILDFSLPNVGEKSSHKR